MQMDHSLHGTEPTLDIPRLTFLGATESVDGSMHLLDTGRLRILLDCGRVLDGSASKRPPTAAVRRSFPTKAPRLFPFDPESIDCVLLTHAHVDHCGNLPLLVKNGFRGIILCSPATRDLIEVVLMDSARIHERDRARSGYRTYGRANAPSLDTFYSIDVENTMDLVEEVPFGTWMRLRSNVQVRQWDSGHVLGSSMFEIEFTHQGEKKRVVFTGDIGRNNVPFNAPPSMIPDADLVVCESTYGGRSHEPFEKTLEEMASVICETIRQGGKVLIPAFSLGRIHHVRQSLIELLKRKQIPNVPIYLDSPLSMDLDVVYEDFGQGIPMDEESSGFSIEWLEGMDDAWYRTTEPSPSVIIASGGMCEGGRILDHLRYHIDDPRSCLMLVSHQSETSLGARLLETTPVVRFHGKLWNKWIQIKQLTGFSAHGDQNDLTHALREVSHEDSKICLVHGEQVQKEAFRAHLENIGFNNVLIPNYRDTISLD
jgi:metallo-beta-lactamase family protein